jgi:hypothetical protein
MLLVASYYDSAFTRQFALRLRSSVESLGMKCRLFDRSERPELRAPSGWKPRAILGALEAYPEDDVFLVDPDSVMNRRPDILMEEKDYDAAVHYDVETLDATGPVYFRNSARSKRMLRVWREINRALPEKPDLENLSRVLSHPQGKIELRRLPVTYAWVERLHRQRYPRARPVLTHFWTDGLLSTRIKVAR